MKTKEFIKEVENLGAQVEKDNFGRLSIRAGNVQIGNVSIRNIFEMSLYNSNFAKDEASKLQKIMYKYSRTPIEDREEEKKYLVKVPESWVYFEKYFAKISPVGLRTVSQSVFDNKPENAYFTMQEIKHYHLESFEKVEVEE